MDRTDSLIINKVRLPLAVFVVILHTNMATTIVPNVNIFFQEPSAFIYVLLSCCITYVAVPSFFFFSGYLFFSKLQEWKWNIYSAKIKKRVKTIIVPYFLWISLFLIYNIPWIVHESGGGGNWLEAHGWFRLYWDNNRIGENPDNLYNIIGIPMHHQFPVLTPMWYLRDLMMVCLLSPIVWLIVTKLKSYGLIVIAVMMCLNIWIPFEGFSAKAFLFFSWGAFFRINCKSFSTVFSQFEWPCYILVFLTVFGALFLYTSNRLWSAVIINVYTIFGLPVIVNIAHRILEKKSGMTDRYSEASFFVYASHIMVMGIWSLLFSFLWPSHTEFSLIVQYLLIVVLTVGTCIMSYTLMKKTLPKTLALLTGGR